MRIVFGLHSVSELVQSRPKDVQQVLLRAEPGGADQRREELAGLCKGRKVDVRRVADEQLDALCDGRHQGVVAVVGDFPYADEGLIEEVARAGGVCVFLDGITDPHNLGAIVRSAAALGVGAVVIPKDRACDVTATVVRTSAGATERMPIVKVVNLARAARSFVDAGGSLVAADVDATEACYEADLTGAMGLVIGAEDRPIRPALRKHIDRAVTIPTSERMASLNASVAAGVLIYEVMRQRGNPEKCEGNTP